MQVDGSQIVKVFLSVAYIALSVRTITRLIGLIRHKVKVHAPHDRITFYTFTALLVIVATFRQVWDTFSPLHVPSFLNWAVEPVLILGLGHAAIIIHRHTPEK